LLLIVAHCNSLQHTSTDYNTQQYTATPCNLGRLFVVADRCTLQRTATQRNTLQTLHVREPIYCCSSLHTATHCNSLQLTATHCNTLQHSASACNLGSLFILAHCCHPKVSQNTLKIPTHMMKQVYVCVSQRSHSEYPQDTYTQTSLCVCIMMEQHTHTHTHTHIHTHIHLLPLRS